jgi:tRNA (guanosine-2'-O-)-methyltransferase
LLAALSLAACSARGTSNARAGAAGTLLTLPLAQAEPSACISTAPERCFDATDDNCNGIIDEGCGIETGPVQFAVAWEPARVDVDLLVTDPAGELAEVGRPLASGLVKQRDCPGRSNECRGQNLENVYLDAPEAPRGTYRVRVVLESLAGQNPPVLVRFGARIGQQTYGMTLRLDQPQGGYETTFTL